jgi:hypothetical protein
LFDLASAAAVSAPANNMYQTNPHLFYLPSRLFRFPQNLPLLFDRKSGFHTKKRVNVLSVIRNPPLKPQA